MALTQPSTTAQPRQHAAEFKDVSFDYPLLGVKLKKLARNLINRPPKTSVGGSVNIVNRKASVHALHHINLTIPAGSRIGIVGPNGAGKSTLLRLIAGIYQPTTGTVQTHGQVAAIFGSSHGMDDELSGYDNIKIRGLFLNRSDAEIEERTREIADFCELGDFLHLPIRTYSPGMKARLGFSTSTAFRPDLLLLDEWLGVADKQFNQRAQQRMQTFFNHAGTVLLASHNEKLIERNCDSIIRLEQGRLTAIEPLADRSQAQAEPKPTPAAIKTSA